MRRPTRICSGFFKLLRHSDHFCMFERGRHANAFGHPWRTIWCLRACCKPCHLSQVTCHDRSSRHPSFQTGSLNVKCAKNTAAFPVTHDNHDSTMLLFWQTTLLKHQLMDMPQIDSYENPHGVVRLTSAGGNIFP